MKKVYALLLLFMFMLFVVGCTPTSHGDAGYMITSIEEFNQALYPDNGSDNADAANREEVYITPLLSIGYPAAKEGVTIEHFCYTYGYSYPCEVAFTINGILYRFNYQYDEGEIDRTGWPLIATYQLGDRSLNMYQGQNCLVGEFYENGYEVMVIVRNYTSVDDIDFDAITWIRLENANHEPS